MSTSPDTQKGNPFAKPPARSAQTTRTTANPGLILLRGLLWLALLAGLVVALAMYYEIVWDVLVTMVFPAIQTVFEVVKDALISLFQVGGVSAAIAPMATAYTGFVLVLGVIYLTARRAIRGYQAIQAKKRQIVQTYVNAWDEWYGNLRAKTIALTDNATEKFMVWWNSLDFYNKVFAAMFIVLIGIPVMGLIAFILGNLVASLL